MGTRSLSLVGAALVSAVVLTACGDEVGTDLPIVDLPADLIYVTDSAGGLHVFDASTLARLGSLPVGDEPSEVHATPDGALVWVLSRGSNSISLIETATHEVKTVGVGVSPVHSYIAPDYGTIWVGNDGSASVSVIDVATRSLLETVITGAGH
ncbi:MAG: hypothetical protein H5U40_17915, partial [Polyangiaceae bacterium]|nr:hypothetical protein [Polyangiaceae bacterium]